MKEINLYLSSQHDNSRAIACCGFYYTCGEDVDSFTWIRYSSHSINLQIQSCLFIIEKIRDLFEPDTVVRIHTKYASIMDHLFNPPTLKTKSSPYLYYLKQAQEVRGGLDIQVINEAELDLNRLSYAENLCDEVVKTFPVITNENGETVYFDQDAAWERECNPLSTLVYSDECQRKDIKKGLNSLFSPFISFVTNCTCFSCLTKKFNS